MSTTTLWSDVMNQACPSIYPDPGLGPSFTLHPNPFMSKNLDVEVKVTRIQTCLRFYTYINTGKNFKILHRLVLHLLHYYQVLQRQMQYLCVYCLIWISFEFFWFVFFFFAHFKKQTNKTTILLWPQWHGPSSWIALWRLAHKSRCRSPPRWTGLLPLLDTAETTFQTLCFKYFSDSNVKTIQIQTL